ncbi:hypothetical protein INT47_004349 [Mucor saturninus]|uniref:UBX domain-containing protein n=1 Tax=Mucor saturninus TaxID=64648 RepID=A0A8H7QU09_9FUNG|nr:hypothetical protein INT47_004349 [Mucor saturninus]
MSSEQDILKFCDITGASPEVAENFLQVADNNVEMAVSLFLENGGDMVANQSRNNEPSVNSSRPSSINSEHMLTDEEFARQMQESEQVRAPIAPKNDILAGGLFQPPSRWTSDHVGSSRPSVFNQGDSATGSVSDFLSRLNYEGNSGSGSSSPIESLGSPATAKAKRLADLFRPPFDIMYRGNFEEARDTAKEKNKWLMINVQNPTEFACQVMNRDLWSDGIVKDIVKESFIFLQYTNESADGKRYSTFYSVSGYPHLAIIDARTGERVKVWEKQIGPTDFMMEITEFLEQNSPESSTRSTATMKRPRVTKNFSDMSEEEQLNAAIAASLTGPKSESPESSKMELESTPKLDEEEPKEKEIVQVEVEEIKAGSTLDGIKAIKRDETTDMANSTRIQLRLADGSRMIRRFLKSDPVRYIFEFVKAEVPNADTQPFELVFNRAQLIDLLDQSILEAGLVNAAVNCVFV